MMITLVLWRISIVILIIVMEGFELCSSSSDENSFGKYEVALLCCGLMHVHFGHPKLALEVLTEAVRASQQVSNDSCLAYTLTVICSLLSQFGITSTTRILGSSNSPMTSIDSSLTIHQQLYVLLRRALSKDQNNDYGRDYGNGRDIAVTLCNGCHLRDNGYCVVNFIVKIISVSAIYRLYEPFIGQLSVVSGIYRLYRPFIGHISAYFNAPLHNEISRIGKLKNFYVPTIMSRIGRYLEPWLLVDLNL